MNTTSPYTGRPLPGNSTFAKGAAKPASSIQDQASSIETRQRTLASIIRPQARDRWLSQSLSTYTPEFIESVIRGAMAGNLVAQWQMFDLMEGTWPRLLKNVMELKDGALSFDWTLQPWAAKGQKPTPEAQRRADLIEELVWNMSPIPDSDENDFEDTIWNLCDARGKGIAVLEIDWEPRQTRFGPAFAPRATRWIHPRYYGYPITTDAPDRLMLNLNEVQGSRFKVQGSGLQVLAQPGEWMVFPDNKFILGFCKSKSGHPIGGALLRTLGFWWAASNFASDWFLNFAQIFGQPFRWATYDPNLTPGDQDILENWLADMGSHAYAMFPSGTQLELKEAAKGAGDNPQMALLNFADKLCDILLLRQTLTTDVQDSGSRALGGVHQDVLQGVKHGVANWAARTLNRQFIQAICRLNFGNTEECPWLQAEIEDQRDPKATAEFYEIASRIVDLPKADTYEKLGIPMPGSGDDVIPRASAAPAAPFGVPPSGGSADIPVRPVPARAKAAPEAMPDLVRQAVADAAGARMRWLAPVAEELDRLIAAAKADKLSDRDLIDFLDAAGRNLPDLFARMDVNSLADSLEDALGTAAVRGLRTAQGSA